MASSAGNTCPCTNTISAETIPSELDSPIDCSDSDFSFFGVFLERLLLNLGVLVDDVFFIVFFLMLLWKMSLRSWMVFLRYLIDADSLASPDRKIVSG